MHDPVRIVERVPTADEYLHLIASVGWRPRDRRAVEVALQHTFYAVCATTQDRTIGFGRVIGDGALHFYLTDVAVHPAYQRRGVGSRIVTALTKYVESMPYQNVLVAVLPTPGLIGFYAKHGYDAQRSETPIMQRWVNGAVP